MFDMADDGNGGGGGGGNERRRQEEMSLDLLRVNMEMIYEEDLCIQCTLVQLSAFTIHFIAYKLYHQEDSKFESLKAAIYFIQDSIDRRIEDIGDGPVNK